MLVNAFNDQCNYCQAMMMNNENNFDGVLIIPALYGIKIMLTT